MNYCITGITYITDLDTEIVLSLRDENGNRVPSKLVPYTPYFYIEEYQQDLFNKFLEKEPKIEDYIIGKERGYQSFQGKSLIKILVRYPKIIGLINKKIKGLWKLGYKIRLYESNILFTNRFLIDKGIYTGINDKLEPVDIDSKHRIVMLDIEILTEEKWKEDSYKYPIIVIGLCDYNSGQFYSIFTKAKETELEVPNTVQIPCKDEIELIKKFKEIWTKISPDVVVTFSPFDIDYIYERLKKLKIDLSFLSPVGIVSDKKHIHCLDILDYSELYSKVCGEPSYSTLDYVAKKELGYGKIELPSQIYQLWETNPELVVKYNHRDVKLLKDLEDKLYLIKNFIIPIWKKTGLPFSKCIKPHAIADILYLRDSSGKFVWRSYAFIEAKPYKGALVEAVPGIYENVAILDWRELYPSLMETFNISWDTYSEFGGDVKIKENLEFSTKEPGQTIRLMMPFRKLRDNIRELRKQSTNPHKKRMLKTLSEAYKVIINSLYGMYGYYPKNDSLGSRLYFPEVASATTFLGRLVYTKVKEFIKSIGYERIYADTDSVFIKLKTENLEDEANSLAKQIQDFISEFIRKTYKVESTLKMEVQTICKRIIILTKKRYYGITYDGEEIIKGLEIIRRESANITVKVEKEVSKMILDGQVDKVNQYINNICDQIRKGQIPLEDIAIKARCTKENYKTLTRNFKGMKIGEKLTGKKIKFRDRYYLLYIVPKRNIKIEINDKEYREVPLNVIGLVSISDLPKDLQVDIERMIDYTVIRPIEKYLEICKSKGFKYNTLDNYF